MRLRLVLVVILTLFRPALAWAHLGSPDVFYDGMAGPWPTRVTIHMPVVVPGRAEILVRVESKEAVEVTFQPLFSRTAVSNTPPPEAAEPVRGDPGLYHGQLWLMTSGAYSILVRIRGPAGEAAVQIPVNSVATAELPLPPSLGRVLLALGLILFCGGIAIVAAAAGESALPPGVSLGGKDLRKYWIAAGVTGAVFVLALVGGRKWWRAEEMDFRARLREGGWPELAATARVEGSQRLLSLTLGSSTQPQLDLAPDHGKLLHLFLVSQPGHHAFGHVHPVRRGDRSFEVTLPPLPEGDYELFCDLTFASGFSSTATNLVHLPAPPRSPAPMALAPDPDDSWTADAVVAGQETPGADTFCPLPGGGRIIWKAHPPTRSKQDAALQFEVLAPDGQPANLQPYMGMMSHAEVLRADGLVFEHLHPSGNYSMAAQILFDKKMAREAGEATRVAQLDLGRTDSWCGRAGTHSGEGALISFPYAFPTPGRYRLWVQVKTDNQVRTAVFDTVVKEEEPAL